MLLDTPRHSTSGMFPCTLRTRWTHKLHVLIAPATCMSSARCWGRTCGAMGAGGRAIALQRRELWREQGTGLQTPRRTLCFGQPRFALMAPGAISSYGSCTIQS